jgi:hypothetical protein
VINWPDEIVTAIARRRAVLFLGAGVSRNAVTAAGLRPPLWVDVLSEGISQLQGGNSELKRMLKQGDLLTCCQLLKHKMDHKWIPFLESQFLSAYQPSDIHESIFDLDSSIILTPNFDRIYDNFAISKGGNAIKKKIYYDDDLGRAVRSTASSRLILKVHGCIDTPTRLIFTRHEYADARAKHAAFYKVIESLILTHTFVFIGCGMSDPDISLLLEDTARAFIGSPPHYIVTPSSVSSDGERILKENYNLVAVRYSNKNNHAELADGCSELVRLVDSKREELAATTLW